MTIESNPLYEELEEAKSVIEELLYQFAFDTTNCELWTGGYSALESAFRFLGWDDPHPIPDSKCEYPECTERATCGTPTPDGYKRVCGNHYQLLAESGT